jgi:cysteine desulfurase/selenocysteine lyase
VQSLGADFFAFSGHKIFGPTGIGVLYGRRELLDAMPPYQGGGDMIRTVTFEKSTWNELPSKFEAGTPDIAGAIGLGVAMDYLAQFDMADIAAHENDLLDYTTDKLRAIRGVRLIGEAPHRSGAISFVTDDVHPHDLGTFLDRDGVAIRTGHHCAQPVMDFFDIPATARASFALYNTRQDVDAFIDSLQRTIKILS